MKVIYTIARTSLALSVIVLFTVTAFAQDKLLLSEIVVTPDEGEMIEIHNPGGSAVDLTNYYLWDATSSFSKLYYYNIVLQDGTSGGASGSDFHIRFPSGATIAAGAYQTVALDGAVNFKATFGVDPTYELLGTDTGIDDMLPAETGSIGTNPGFSNSGEVAVLYYWDGLTDLVTDIDYVVWGDKNEALDKTGIKIDGPDANTDSTTYAADTDIASQDSLPTPGFSVHASGLSAQRIDFTEGTQTASGSNGVGGSDETSEIFRFTWHVDSTATPNTGPQTIADLQSLLLSEYLVTPTFGEFVEIFNPGPIVVDLTNYYLTDATNSGGTPARYYYNIVLQDGSSHSGFGSDFIVKFPSGATINPGEFQTVAIDGAVNFTATYPGVDPTYELQATDGAVDDMLEAETGSIGATAGLTGAGEAIVLFYWDGATDLVTDLDYVIWGDFAEAVDKTGVTIDGPDGDSDASAYKNDVAVADQNVGLSNLSGKSVQRRDFTEGTEIQIGGNGFGGSDETSENTDITWSADSSATPNRAPQVIKGIDKILLSEIVVSPFGSEYAEIYNPGADTVKLKLYYLTDATQGDSIAYYQIVSAGNTGGGGDDNEFDFHVKFPNDATIAPREYQTVALNGSILFIAAYGVLPTYEVAGNFPTADAIPDMLEIYAGSVGASAGFSDSGEMAVLYFWNAETDLVTDVDYVVWGDKVGAVDKSGVKIDGPDVGTDSTVYNNDVAVADQDVAPGHASGFSMQRFSASEGIEIITGSNGIGGMNEMSEQFSVTWFGGLAPSPNAAAPEAYVAMTIAEMELDANGDFVPDRLGQLVQITGVISTPNLQTSNTSHFIDDGTAGTDIFYFGQDLIYHVGDSITVKGVVAEFGAVTELIPPNGGEDVTFHSSGAEVRIQVVPVSQLKDVNGEAVEGEMVTLDEFVHMTDDLNWPSGVASIDIDITNGVDTVLMRLDSDLGLGGDPRACGEFLLTGIVSQFTFKTPPDDNYSVIPRGFEDMVFKDAATITSATQSGDDGVIVAFTASLRDVSEADDPILNYTAWAFSDDTEDSLGLVTADNSADYTITGLVTDEEAYIVVFANSALCSPWSEGTHFQKVVGIADNDVLPKSFDISANYPNPFNPTTTINYQVPKTAHVKIVIFNLLGQKVATLVDDELVAGFHSTQFNGLTDRGRQLSSGIYFYRMTTGDFSKTQKMMFLK